MSRKIIGFVALMVAYNQVGCSTKQSEPPVDYNTPIALKQFIVGHGTKGEAEKDNPPCIRHGMEDVLGLAKKFGSQSGTQTFGFLGKDITAPPLTLDDPRATNGSSIVQQNVADAMREIKGNTAEALAAESYASCGTVAFLLAKRPGQIRAVLKAGNEQQPLQPCPEGPFDYTKCDVRQAGWSWFHEDTYFVATFKNWSRDHERTARIEIYLKK